MGSHLRCLKALILKSWILAYCMCAAGLATAGEQPPAQDGSDVKSFETVVPKNGDKAPIKVGTRLVKPFVFKEEGELTGFSIDLWNEIAQGLGIETEYDVHETLEELFGAVKDGQDLVAIAAISITSKRELIYDFSQPMFNSGLAILVPATAESGFFSLLSSLNWRDIFKFIILFGILVAIPAHIIWFAERNTGDLISPSYFPGIFQAAFMTAAFLGCQLEGYPKSHVARGIAMLCVYISIIFIAYFTAFVTTSLTVQQLKGDISGPNDLRGKRVASVKNSTASQYVKQIAAGIVDTDNVDEAIQAVLEGKAAAVVYDSPVLLYYVNNADNGKVQIAGETFHNENYGIVFKPGSELRKLVNEQLLKLRENGKYQELYKKWFGQSSSAAA